jgi:hypothetical protein
VAGPVLRPRWASPSGSDHLRAQEGRRAATSKLEADLARDDWFDPDAGKVTLGEFGKRWLDEHPGLAETTHERYEIAFRLYLVPSFGNRPVNEIREADVRSWRAELIKAGKGNASVAKAYRVLRAMLNTAVDDGLIKRNPCRIKGAGDDKSDEPAGPVG